MKKQISNKVAIDTATAREIYHNGEIGDKKVALCVANRYGADMSRLDHIVYYLETNGDPVLVTNNNESQCATDLGLGDVTELKALY